LKVYISADIEGVSGIVGTRQTHSDGMDYARARKLHALDVNAAIEGALEAGATEIIVNDSHGKMNNLWPEDIHPAAKLLIGSPKPLSMMQGIDESFDAAIFIGYHCRVGSRFGTISHTYTGSIHNACVNEKPVGETQLNGAVAGFYGVPVVMVSGDDELAAQTHETNPDIEAVVVKWAQGRGATLCMHPEEARELIKTGAKNALARVKDIAPIKFATPVIIDVELDCAQKADQVERMPRIERIDDVSVRYTAEDYLEAFKAFLSITSIAGTAGSI